MIRSFFSQRGVGRWGWLVLALSASVVACGDDDDDSGTAGAAGAAGSSAGAAGTDGGAGTGQAGNGGAGALTVTPSKPTVLTCSTTAFTASTTPVTWSATAGEIDATGSFKAPKQVGPDVTLTATSQADANVKGSATVTLATAVPGAKQVLADPLDEYPSLYPHAVVARGDRVYAAYGINSDTKREVQVLRSDDGGTTWGAPVVATPPISLEQDAKVTCVSTAIDVENPDVVYVVFNFSSHSGLITKAGLATEDDRGLGLLVSTDGGKTFPTLRFLQTGNAEDAIPVAQGICPDVISFAKDSVAVTTPGGANETVGMFLWSDTNRGAGLTIGQIDDFNSIANGETGALKPVSADVGQNGGTGEATESPYLFTDGKGKMCVTYVAFTPKGSGSPSSAVWLQCSGDGGKTFGSRVVVSPTYAYDQVHVGNPHGTFSPSGKIAIGWHGHNGETSADGKPIVGVAVSSDGGATFANVSALVPQQGDIARTALTSDVHYDASGVLWLGYHMYDGGQNDRVVVDKSCDDGATWSGPVVVNEDSGGVVDHASLPGLVETANGKMAVSARSSTAGSTVAQQMRRYSLTP